MTSNTFQLARVKGQPVTDEELIFDLQRVAKAFDWATVSQSQYEEHGMYAWSTLIRRFGTWNKALVKAELGFSNEVNIPEVRLFENILTIWQHYGRQPRRRELEAPPSTISQSPYNRHFGSWTTALEAFVEYANSDGTELPEPKADIGTSVKTGRDPSLRLRWRVLQRDRFKCCACGASPSDDASVELHVDHITPWSKGGSTVIENLQTLCAKCNLGKSNLLLDQL